MSQESQVAYGEARGFLAAFAHVNSRGDLTCTFEFDLMPEAPNLIEAVDLRLAGQAREIKLTPIPNWRNVIRQALRRWLFDFLVERDRLLKSGSVFWLANQDSQEPVVEWLMERLESTAPEPTVFFVGFLMDVHYECAAEDFVFSSGGQAWFLHLGISD
jgi:hypothetical protein